MWPFFTEQNKIKIKNSKAYEKLTKTKTYTHKKKNPELYFIPTGKGTKRSEKAQKVKYMMLSEIGTAL